MAGQRYQVDLDEMDLALRQLYDIVRRMDAATSKARHETGLVRESLGTGFESKDPHAVTNARMADAIMAATMATRTILIRVRG